MGPRPSDRVRCDEPVELLANGYFAGLCEECGRKERELRDERRRSAAEAAESRATSSRVAKAGVVPFARRGRGA